MSPCLFNLYMDDLSVQLNKSKIGCTMNNVTMNHFLYADDTCILSPSPSAQQKLLDICSEYAKENCLIFNESKTKSMCFLPSKLTQLFIPCLYLNGKSLVFVKEIKYLGLNLSSDFKDDCDILRHIKYIYSRGNLIVNRFKQCSSDVKHLLFKTFCISMYGCMLWSCYTDNVLRKCCVAFNNIYRALFKINNRVSISKEYVTQNVNSFAVLRRKSAYNFLCRLRDSQNTIVQVIYSSQHFIYNSTLNTKWHTILYLHSNV